MGCVCFFVCFCFLSFFFWFFVCFVVVILPGGSWLDTELYSRARKWRCRVWGCWGQPAWPACPVQVWSCRTGSGKPSGSLCHPVGSHRTWMTWADQEHYVSEDQVKATHLRTSSDESPPKAPSDLQARTPFPSHLYLKLGPATYHIKIKIKVFSFCGKGCEPVLLMCVWIFWG